jgi:hypothetical protein
LAFIRAHVAPVVHHLRADLAPTSSEGELTASTIRGVALGVVGVAAIQALLIGVGFFAMGGELLREGLHQHHDAALRRRVVRVSCSRNELVH